MVSTQCNPSRQQIYLRGGESLLVSMGPIKRLPREMKRDVRENGSQRSVNKLSVLDKAKEKYPCARKIKTRAYGELLRAMYIHTQIDCLLCG